MVEVLQLIPTLHVRDVQRAAEWYHDKLGWEIEFVAAPDYAGVTISGQTMHLAQWQRPGDPHPGQVFVRLGSDVDAYAAKLVGRGVVPYQMPKDQPYGVREMNLRDPDGNYLHIGQPIEAHAAEARGSASEPADD